MRIIDDDTLFEEHAYLTGEHLCHYYYGEVHLQAVIMHLMEGLVLKESKIACSLCLEPYTRELLVKEMEVRNHDLEYLREAGKIVFKKPVGRDVYRKGGLHALLSEWCEDTRKRGFNLMIHFGQAVTQLKKVGLETYLFLERQTSAAVHGLPSILICLYPFEHVLLPFRVTEVLRCHSGLITAGTVHLPKNSKLPEGFYENIE